MHIKVKLDDRMAKMPIRAKGNCVGWDLAVCDKFELPHNLVKVDFGVKVAPPEGYYLELVPRSSLFKKGYILANSVGILDPDFRGRVMAYLFVFKKSAEILKPGDRICQLILRRHETAEMVEVDELDSTERGEDAFGSSGE